MAQTAIIGTADSMEPSNTSHLHNSLKFLLETRGCERSASPHVANAMGVENEITPGIDVLIELEPVLAPHPHELRALFSDP
jgi:hypothetical protein